MRRRTALTLTWLIGCGLWAIAPAAADAIDPADQPLVGLGDASSRVTWSASLLSEVERLQRPYVSPFHGACRTEGCFRESGSSHALAHGPSARFRLGLAPIRRHLRGGLNPDLIAPAPAEPPALQRLLER